MQKLAQHWQTSHDWRKAEARLNAVAAVHHRYRRPRHPFHPCPVEARKCTADDRHSWLARLDHRADEDHRAADQSHGPWRKRSGRLPSRDSVAAGLWLLRQADGARLESASHRAGMGDADAAPRIHAVCGAGRRLGQRGHGEHGPAGAARIARHPHQHAGHGSGRHLQGARDRRPPPAGLSADEKHAWDQLDFFFKNGPRLRASR